MKSLVDQLEKGAEELGLTLTGRHLEQFGLFASELCKWNRKINLTSIIQPEEIAIKHFIDSLVLGLFVDVSGDILDIGSGGGFPSIPIKIVYPESGIVSVDAVEKKILFQRHIARLLGFEKFTALHCRIENFPENYNGAFNLVVSRAFSELSEFVKCALPFMANNGVIVAMKGKDGQREAEASTEELIRIGVEVSVVHEFLLPLLKDARSLIVLRKISK